MQRCIDARDIAPFFGVADAEVLADRMLNTIPRNNSLARRVGPVYDTPRVEEITGWRKQGIADRRSRGTILAVKTSDSHWFYPVFQFKGTGMDPKIKMVLEAFRANGPHDTWMIATWFRNPKDRLDGMSPVEWIQRGHDPQGVVSLARGTARQWAA